jgi:type VI secretion system protein ImpG
MTRRFVRSGAPERDAGNYGAYFSLRREQRGLSEHAQRYGTRTGYIGSEVFVSLVDEQHAPGG